MDFTKSFDWNTLNEEQKYEVWTQHLSVGGEVLNYPRFCDILDGYNA